MEFRVKFSDAQPDVLVSSSPGDSFSEVARNVRACKGWDDTQHMRFICGGQEMYMDDKCGSATGSVLHCIPSAQERLRGTGQRGKAEGKASTDMLEVVDPGTVLMWIFGSILALLWMLFVFSAHMFDKTSILMLCMMTIAFLIPCVMSYIPWLRVLSNPITSGSPLRQHVYYNPAGPAMSLQSSTPATAWSSGSMAVPPRPAARVRGPGAQRSPVADD